MAREERTSSLLGSAVSHAREAFVRMMKDQRGEILPGGEDAPTDANSDSEWDVSGQDPAGLDTDPSPVSDETPTPEDGDQPSPAEALKTEPGQEPAKDEGEEKLPFHDHPRWKEVMTELKILKDSQSTWEADKQNLSDQIQFYAEQYNQVVGKTDEQSGQPTPTQPGQAINPQQPAVQPFVPGQLPPNIRGPATQYDKDGEPVGGWENQQQIAQFMDHRAEEIANRNMETAYTEKVAPVFNRLNDSITSMQDMLLGLHFPTKKDANGNVDPNSGWEPAYKEALKDVFAMDDSGKVLAVKNNATLNYWQKQPFPKLAAIEHGMRKLAPKLITEGTNKAFKTTLKDLGKKPTGPTTPATSGASMQNEADIGWDANPKEVEKYLDEKNLI